MSQSCNYINKSDVLEKGISAFPSIYIEGAAASGKSTAVEMLIQRHPNQRVELFSVEEEVKQTSEFLEKLARLRVEMKQEACWLVLDDCPSELPKEVETMIFDIIREISNDSKVILVGREELPEKFLILLWKGKLERISQEHFHFTRYEVRSLVEARKSPLDPVELYQVTGGWPGCVMLMLRLAEQGEKNVSVQKLRATYEVEAYLQQQIIRNLAAEELQLLQKARICPWLNVAICEDVCGIREADRLLEKLYRKGLLLYSERRKIWKLAPLFMQSRGISTGEASEEFWRALTKWYGHHEFFEEMFVCLSQVLDVMEWKENAPEICYLRAMKSLYEDNLAGFEREIGILEKEMQLKRNSQGASYARFAELYLNLRFVDARISVDEWLELVESYWKEEKGCGKLSLYGRKDQWISCLGGMRDLSDLFACSKKEENRKARIWKSCLGENEWSVYQIARVEYYMETDQRDLISEDDRFLIRKVLNHAEEFSLPVYYILCHLHKDEYDEELRLRMKYLEDQLISEDSFCREGAEAVVELKGLLLGDKGELLHWSHERESALESPITKDNVVFYYCRAKGYLYLEQYERARKILHKLALYLKKRRNTRFLAEVLFEQAIVLHELGQSGKALQSAIESFLVNGDRHYVGFYTEYGQRGKAVLEMYVDWLKKSEPEGWQRKKKYKYGNVVRMPQNDYLEYLLRKAKHRRVHNIEHVQRHKAESLTMMEMIVLQSISLGMTNAEICEELNLKLPTVKSHIYNLYKKLGVKNRTQAIVCGQEMKIKKKEK